MTALFDLFAQSVGDLEGLVGLVEYAGLGAGLYVGYRVTKRAADDATAAARLTAQDANEQLVLERARSQAREQYWVEREAVLLATVSELQRDLLDDRNPKGTANPQTP